MANLRKGVSKRKFPSRKEIKKCMRIKKKCVKMILRKISVIAVKACVVIRK